MTEEEFIIRNEHKSNSHDWSSYQKLVLSQLEDHKNIMNELKQSMILTQQEILLLKTKMESSDENRKKINDKLDHILYNDNGINSRLKSLENNVLIKKGVSVKLIGIFSAIGAVLGFILKNLSEFISQKF
jgi:hypothetical protein